MPVTYPLEENYSIVNEGIWGTWRVSTFGNEGVPVVPILQMIGIPEMGLSQPSVGQVQAQIMSALEPVSDSQNHLPLRALAPVVRPSL